jgi:hypothetical protein
MHHDGFLLLFNEGIPEEKNVRTGRDSLFYKDYLPFQHARFRWTILRFTFWRILVMWLNFFCKSEV